MGKQKIEVSYAELVERIRSMSDDELIQYAALHVTLDSGVLVEVLVERLRTAKRDMDEL